VSAGSTQLLARDAAAQGQDRDAAVLEQLRRANGDPRRRVLLRGGTIISMDTTVGDFVRADLLIEGKKISAVATDLGATAQGGNAISIDAGGTILIPGMIDCHRHAWEGQIRGVIPNSATIGDYMGATHRGFAPYYRPEGKMIRTANIKPE
jgi:imidazolonepropionase-like amidohydrolase